MLAFPQDLRFFCHVWLSVPLFSFDATRPFRNRRMDGNAFFFFSSSSDRPQPHFPSRRPFHALAILAALWPRYLLRRSKRGKLNYERTALTLRSPLFPPGTHDGDPGGGPNSMTLYLNRHTGLNISCRVRFNLRIGGGDGGGGGENDNGEGVSNGSGGAPMVESG